MPRLDVWLVETGRFSSRQAAKRAIKAGNVTVDRTICKPSKQITGSESIEIHVDHADMPRGFHKLKMIDDFLGGNLVTTSCIALDIGSSAGGFLAYLSHKGAQATGIEVSERFIKELSALSDTNQKVAIIFADAFKIEPTSVVDECTLDLLLIDVTTGVSGTLDLISKFCSLLKKSGRLVAAFKTENNTENVLHVIESIRDMGFEELQSIDLDDSCQEVHITACRM